MIKLTLKDGSVKEIEAAMPAAEVVKGIGMGLYKSACCVKIDGQVCDLRTNIDKDCTFEVMTFDSDEGKKTFWHTASHILAQAVKRLYPNVKLAIGPAIDGGFYYDFDTEKAFTADELTALEAEMKKLSRKISLLSSSVCLRTRLRLCLKKWASLTKSSFATSMQAKARISASTGRRILPTFAPVLI